MIALFAVVGGIEVVVKTLYRSYLIWPVRLAFRGLELSRKSSRQGLESIWPDDAHLQKDATI